MNVLWQILWVGLGGALGALSRLGISHTSQRFLHLAAPWPTFIANMTGCFLIGLLFELTADKGLVGEAYRPFLLTGFLGSLTTFSTFKHDNFTLINSGMWINAAINIILQVFLGLLFVWLGSRAALLPARAM